MTAVQGANGNAGNGTAHRVTSVRAVQRALVKEPRRSPVICIASRVTHCFYLQGACLKFAILASLPACRVEAL